MRQVEEILASKNAVLTRLNAELETAKRMYRAADAYSPAERWYGQQITILHAAIDDVKHEIANLRFVIA